MNASLAQKIARVLESMPAQGRRGHSILDLLQRVEAAIGYIPRESIPRLAQSLGVTDAQVAGVLSHYPDLHTGPRGRHVIRLCQGEACLANHGSRVLHQVCSHVHAAVGETTTDGRYTIETVYCVGNCGVSPTMVVDGEIHGRVTPDQIPAMVERYR